jgi:hypothetical protein
MKIMQALQNNLEAKAKQYKDPALMHIFLMNNIHYIVKSVRRYVLIPSNARKKVTIVCVLPYTLFSVTQIRGQRFVG